MTDLDPLSDVQKADTRTMHIAVSTDAAYRCMKRQSASYVWAQQISSVPSYRTSIVEWSCAGIASGCRLAVLTPTDIAARG